MPSGRKFHQEQFLGTSKPYKVKNLKSPIRTTDSTTVELQALKWLGRGC